MQSGIHISFRIDPGTKAILDQCARAERRSMSSMIGMIILEYGAEIIERRKTKASGLKETAKEPNTDLALVDLPDEVT